MPLKLKGGGALKIRSYSRSDFGVALFDYQEIRQHISGGGTVVITDDDVEFTRHTGATYYSGGVVKVISNEAVFTLVNQNPEVATIETDGTINRISEGFCRLSLVGPVTISMTLDLTNKLDGGDVDTDPTTAIGSLAKHLQDQVDSRIDNSMSMAVNGKVFTSQNHASATYVRNSDLWCADVDLTCISPWNSDYANRKAGTLVTPRHIVNSAHYEYPVGTSLRFVAADGMVHTRSVVGKKRHPDYKPYYPDLTVYTLDSDLPVSITPCKVLPANWGNYLSQNAQNRPPGFGLDQEEKALIIDFISHRNSTTTAFFSTPTDADRLIFHESKISGDSGNPAFFIVNGDLVLVTVWTSGGSGAGTIVSGHIAALNQMIIDSDAQAGVSTGYFVTEADFTAFPSYP
jgi:hypothetical protein